MNYQTFRGADVQEALFNVRQALGTDALIESTRHVQNGASGALGRPFVEIIAAPSAGGDAARGAISLAPAVAKGRALPTERSLARGSAPRASKNPPPPSTLDESAVGRELMQLRMMLDELGRGRPIKDRTRAMLAAAGFEGALARTLSTGSGRAAKLGNRELMHWLRERVRERLSCRSGLIEAPGRRLIACVGPTGVGKTTTLAKLAARAVLQLGRSVRVVSLDTFRVGAVEQWRRYAELIGFSFDVANNPGTFHRVAHNHTEDILLVDTAGRAIGDQHSTLAGCVSGLRDMSHEVLLVLPAWLRARDAERVVSTYAEPKITGVV
ncbi:MAG TPA: flagellar biosynthesis protein FlhF, partial [Polyangiaceae bacterium]|nr:flagellar biosynthesis protein FlhF [Polyangiaceae bacterium]